MITINKIARAGILGGLLMGAVTLNASNPITTIDKAPNQTEVVSKEGAAALKAASLQVVQQNSTIHNTRIDNMYRKFASNTEEKNTVNSIIKSTYAEKGSSLASAILQHELDRQQLFLLLEENGDLLIKNDLNPKLGEDIAKFGPDFYKSVRPNAKKISDWLDNKYTPALLGLLAFDYKPNAKEVIKRLDDIAENKANFNTDDILMYKVSSNSYKTRNKINDKTSETDLLELIAYKMNLIDKIIFKKTLTNNDVFGANSRLNKYTILADYYDNWMRTVSPNK